MDLVPVPVRERDVVSAGQDLSARCLCGRKDLPASSIKRNVRAIGQRLEREAKQATASAAYSFRRANRLPLTGPPLAVQIDAGYIKTTRPQADGKRWVPVIASKLVRSSPGRGYAHASALGLGKWQGMRQQAFLQSIGVDRQSPITVLSDGGDDISHACKLPAATARVLDWFHIGMRFEQLLLSLRGLRGADAYTKYRLEGDVIAAKWLLWNGRRSSASRSSKRCGERRAGSERITHWASSSATCAAALPSSPTTHIDERSSSLSPPPARSPALIT